MTGGQGFRALSMDFGKALPGSWMGGRKFLRWPELATEVAPAGHGVPGVHLHGRWAQPKAPQVPSRGSQNFYRTFSDGYRARSGRV